MADISLLNTTLSLYVLVILMLLVGLIGIVWYGVRMLQAITLLAATDHRALMIPGFSWVRFILKLFVWGIAVLVASLALLRPQYRLTTAQERYEYGRDLVIAVDISRSMLVEDCGASSRLAAAKKKIIEVVQHLPAERIALIVFSGSALVQCPLTKDGAAFRMFVDSLDTEVLAGGTTTSLSAALRAGIALFAETSMRKNKLALLITDGEDFSSDFASAQQDAQKAGLQVSVIGVGTPEGGPIPLYNAQGVCTGHQRDGEGTIVISRLNEKLLKSLVTSSGGLYAHIDQKGSVDIDSLISWVKAREAERGVSALHENRAELHMFCSGCALCLLIILWILL